MKGTNPIDGSTIIRMIIGDPVSHSLSPAVHNAWYSARGLNHCMVAAQVREGLLAEAIKGVRALSIAGLAVTMPHKASIIPLLDLIDPVANAIGAVNTVVNSAGVLTGYNTDWLGILKPLQARTSLVNKKVAVIGAGGAAKAAAYACSINGGSVTILNRTVSKAAGLAKSFNLSWGDLNRDTEIAEFDIVINTTPIGMGELVNQTPIDSMRLTANQIIFESIYSPKETELVKHALSKGCQVIFGEEMFLEQAAAQFELHTKEVLPA